MLESWPVAAGSNAVEEKLPTTMICNTSAALMDVAVAGLGIACLTLWCVRLWRQAN